MLSIVTINYKTPSQLMLTCSSIDEQESKDIEHIVVASGLESQQILEIESCLTRSYRKFIFNKDKSLYNAMNLGLKSSSGNAILFLNGGDTFRDKNSLSIIYRKLGSNQCLAFRAIQVYGKHAFIRPGLKSNPSLPPCHQAFISPLDKNITFRENKKINADLYWMRDCIKKYGLQKHNEITTIFYLNGISNTPNTNLLKAHISSREITHFIKSFLKLFMLKALGKDLFYLTLAKLKKYDRL